MKDPVYLVVEREGAKEILSMRATVKMSGSVNVYVPIGKIEEIPEEKKSEYMN